MFLRNINKLGAAFYFNDGTKIDVMAMYFVRPNFDGQKIDIVSMYFFM